MPMKNVKELEQDMMRVRTTLAFYVKEMEFLERQMRLFERRRDHFVRRQKPPNPTDQFSRPCIRSA